MIFRNFAERILGSKVKVKILVYMLAENVPTSERELARILGVSHMAVNKAMKDFYSLNLISPLRIGNVVSWRLNERSYSYEAVTDIRRIARNPPLQDLKGRIAGKIGGLGLEKAVIFGSIAEGKEEPNSDIDLLVVAKDGQQKKRVTQLMGGLSEDCMQRYGNSLSPYIIIETEMKKPANKRILRSAENGIVII